MYLTDDTICAVATPPGGAGRGIVRLSGPDSHRIALADFTPAASFSGRACPALFRRSADSACGWFGCLRLPRIETSIPVAVCVWPAGRGYTGQAAAELHLPGSPPLLEAVVAWACQLGARPAERGEFTLRAFLAGRVDLAQAEAVLGTIEAEDPRQLDVALRQLAGGLSGPIQRLRDELLALTAELEAGLDFADENLDTIDAHRAAAGLAEVETQLDRLRRQMGARGRTDAMAVVILAGRPNSGKSSLFNALLGSESAIVDAAPGTTRDYLRGQLDLAAAPCALIDTAGRDEGRAIDAIDRLAHEQAMLAGEVARLRLLCIDQSRPLSAWDEGQLARFDPHSDLLVLTKGDLPSRVHLPADGPIAVHTSARTGEGLDVLRSRVEALLRADDGSHGEIVAATAARAEKALMRAFDAVSRARKLSERTAGDELIAGELRVALDELGRVVGTVYTDDVLDRLFERFCIGK